VPNAHYPFAIIGAGPAGATCANLLQRELGGNVSVALIDKARFPRDKSCGDGLGPGVIGILDELGLQDILKSHERVTLMAMSSPLGSRVVLDTKLYNRRSPLGYVIPRKEFDFALVEAALARGATDFTGWGLESAIYSDQRWNLALSCGETGETRQLTADVLVGADGATSKIRRVLGQRLSDDRNVSIAIRIYAKSPVQIPARQQLDMVKGLPSPGYGWVFATGGEVVNVGIGADVLAYKAQKLHINEMLTRYRQFLDSAFEFDEQSTSTSLLPSAPELPQLSYPSTPAALIGDAASMINPLTGEGIFYGMYAGLLLGKRLAAAHKHAHSLAEALCSYETDFRAIFMRHFRGTWLLRKMLERPILLDRMIRACGRKPDLCYDYIDYMMGDEHTVNRKPLYNLALRTLFP
jgi:geranylgeranyl reductase family protein